ncbi:tetratricopeptide repeat protein [Gaoshiqia sp. Z1-71]|uniref:tetratricopeptide repeat protein n=1 Tax=Gaoshiqia hydrogeniformans TaxID=3290090 RepID=UPI003BF79E1F
MKRIILLYLIFVHINLFAQQHVDSLKAVLPELQGEAKAEVLNQLSSILCQTDSVQSMAFARQALAQGQSIPNREVSANAYSNLAECCYYHDQYEQALRYYTEALAIYSELGNNERIGDTYNSIGLVHYYKGEYDLAIENQLAALNCLENVSDRHELAHVYSNMGMVYSRLGYYEVSIENYRKAAVINREIDDPYSLAVNHNGMGVGYYNLGQLDSSKVNYGRSLTIFRQMDDKRRVAIALNNIANIYVDEGDSLQQALSYYEEAYAVFDELKDVRNKTFVLEGMGCVYRAMGNRNKALQVFREGLDMAITHKLGHFIRQRYYEDLSVTYEMLGRTRDAFEAYRQHIVYRDSMRQENQLQQIAVLEKKFEIEKKEAEIAHLNSEREIAHLQIQKDKVIRLFGIIVILLLMAVIVYVSFSNYNKKKVNILLNQKNTQIETQKNELEIMNVSKNKLFSIIAHDLKNPLHTMMGYSYLLNQEYDRFNDTERKKHAGDIYQATNNLFRLLQNLLDWSRSQTGRLKYDPVRFELRDLYNRIHSLMKPVAEQKNIRLETTIPDDLLVYADPMMVDTILRNLINNAIKFSKEGSVVKTGISRLETDITVCVTDEGIGMSEQELQHLFSIDPKVKRKGTNNEDGSGLGLILCHEFVQINGGKIWALSEEGKGSTFCFTIPSDNVQS